MVTLLVKAWQWVTSKLVPVLVALALGLLSLLYREKYARARDAKRQAEATRDTERNATDEMVEGLKRESEVKHAPIDTSNRSDLE